MMPLPNRLATKLVIGLACALLLALLIHDRNHWKAKTAHYAELLSAERGAHAATVATVRAATEQARAADRSNFERVKALQSAINIKSEGEYEKRLADARAAAGRLRGERPRDPADPRSRGAASVPGLPFAAGGPSETAGQDRLPDADKLIATEQAIQLDELIKWVERQAALDPGGAPSN